MFLLNFSGKRQSITQYSLKSLAVNYVQKRRGNVSKNRQKVRTAMGQRNLKHASDELVARLGFARTLANYNRMCHAKSYIHSDPVA